MTNPDGSLDDDRPSLMPVLIALGIVAFVLIAMTVFRMIGGDRATDESLVGRAVVAQNDALQREDYSAFRGYTCLPQQGTQADVIAGQQRSKTDRGARFVDDVTDIKFDSGHTLELSLWSRNLLKEQHTFQKSFNTATRFTSGIYNEPRTFGLDLTVRY